MSAISPDTATNTKLVFEQPLTEAIRICLRLEQLFLVMRDNLTEENHAKQAIYSLLRIINAVDRPDIRSKITQTLTQFSTSLAQLEQFPQVDQSRLKQIVNQFDQLTRHLHEKQCKIGDILKGNHFLNQLRLQLSNPSGICSFNNPALKTWLSQSNEIKFAQLQEWFAIFKELETSVTLILEIIRQSHTKFELVATNGIYHRNLDPSLPCELLQIHLNGDINVYPEFSVGRHRLALRFVKPNYYQDGQPIPSTEDISFILFCCRL